MALTNPSSLLQNYDVVGIELAVPLLARNEGAPPLDDETFLFRPSLLFLPQLKHLAVRLLALLLGAHHSFFHQALDEEPLASRR